MKNSTATLILSSLLFTSLLIAGTTRGQSRLTLASAGQEFKPEGEGNAISSNVPLNEINIHAFRHFRKSFPGITDENWWKTEEGDYIVSFLQNARRTQIHYGPRGGFQYSVRYFPGKEIAQDMKLNINKVYPQYAIDVVTEISDGTKSFCLVKIESSFSVKTLLICDGKTTIYEDLVNGGH